MRWLSPPKSKPRQLERAEDNGARLSNQLELMGWAAGLLELLQTPPATITRSVEAGRHQTFSKVSTNIFLLSSSRSRPSSGIRCSATSSSLRPSGVAWRGGAGAAAYFGNIQFSFKTVLWKLIKVRKTILLHYTSILNSIPDLRLVLEFIVIGLPAVTTNHY